MRSKDVEFISILKAVAETAAMDILCVITHKNRRCESFIQKCYNVKNL